MKVKLLDLVKARESIIELSGLKLPLDLAFKIGDLVEEIEKNNIRYEVEKDKIVQKYAKPTGEMTEDGMREKYDLPTENTEIYSKEIDELNNFEIDIEIEKIKLPEWVTLTGENARKIKYFIER